MTHIDLTKKFDENMAAKVTYPDFVDILGGVLNTHTHPRDTIAEGDGRAEMHIPLLADAYTDVLAMGNTKVPLTTPELSLKKGAQWDALIPFRSLLQIRRLGLMTESSTAAEVIGGYDMPEGKEAWSGIKMFMRSVSNAHGADVDNLSSVLPVIKAMSETKFQFKKGPMPLSVHAERKQGINGKRIFFLDRDKESMDRDIMAIFNAAPRARVIICHVKSKYTVDLIQHLRYLGFDIWGEIAPHYTMFTCDDLFEGPGGSTMFNAHLFCLPIFGTEMDRNAVMEAMLSGEPFWFFGDDEACHWDDPTQSGSVKINSDGYVVGGQTQIPKAVVSYVIEKFAEAGKIHLLQAFLADNGREAFHLPRRPLVSRFERYDWPVDEYVYHTAGDGTKRRAKVAMGGKHCKYWSVPTEAAA